MFFRGRGSETVTEKQVLEALAGVQDPDLKRDIVTLGFVKQLTVQGGAVSFTVELTTPACPAKEELEKQCEAAVRALPGVKDVKITMSAAVKRTHSAGGAGRLEIPGVAHVVAVASGKGGVGKSTVTVNLAVALAETGARVGVLDADIYGPSIPLMLGTRDERPLSDPNDRIYPIEKYGISMLSIGHLVPEDKAMIWRGPMVHGALTQFLTQVVWGDLDYLLLDMPPGTGDAQLTISQNAPLSGAVLVTTPQEVSLLDARRGLAMFTNVRVPILGIVENMSGFVCGHCNETTKIFSVGGGEKLAEDAGVPLLARVPIDPRIAEGGDQGIPVVVGQPSSPAAEAFRTAAGLLAAQLSVANAFAAPELPTFEWKPPPKPSAAPLESRP